MNMHFGSEPLSPLLQLRLSGYKALLSLRILTGKRGELAPSMQNFTWGERYA